MPAENFAPNAGGSVDPAKLYLIKGSTLADLLKKTTFSPEDFEVQDSTTGRTVRIRKASEADGLNGLTLDVFVWQYTYDNDGHLYNPPSGPSKRLVVRDGRVIALESPYDVDDATYPASSISLDVAMLQNQA